LPILTLAFGWGFLITELLTGGQLGAGVPFRPELIAQWFLQIVWALGGVASGSASTPGGNGSVH